jgi:hypothetical protein
MELIISVAGALTYLLNAVDPELDHQGALLNVDPVGQALPQMLLEAFNP